MDGSGKNADKKKIAMHSVTLSIFRSESERQPGDFAKSETSVEVWNALHSTNKIPDESPTATATNTNDVKTEAKQSFK